MPRDKLRWGCVPVCPHPAHPEPDPTRPGADTAHPAPGKPHTLQLVWHQLMAARLLAGEEALEGEMGTRTPVWGPGPCAGGSSRLICAGPRWWQREMVQEEPGKAREGGRGPDGLIPRAAHRVLSPGWGAALGGDNVPSWHQDAQPSGKGLGSLSFTQSPPASHARAGGPRLSARIPGCPCGCGHESIQDWITPTSTKPWGHPHSCCQPGPGASTGVCGKCLSPWEWAGLQRDPQSRWSQTLGYLQSYTITPCFGWTFVPPIPVPRGAVGTDIGLWGHCRGHTWVALGTQGDTRTVGICRGSPGMCTGVMGTGTPMPTGAPLPWQWPGLKKRREIPGAALPGAVMEHKGGRRARSPPGYKPPPSSSSSTDNPAGLRSPSLYLCTKDVILPDSGQYSQLKANLCK
nr:collagen alpha-4(IV) chain-like isoform X1 [Zonotrichia albicollis]XP_005497677.1 collagen alpha-4(IV) chain-like isoform X2 [Zonotrichia albicollis]XP_026655117.1 collagen alpha-4(IV) chain-like isoform X3 [Zonotrichia albicollis]